MSNQISKYPDIRYFWSENVRCPTVISSSAGIYWCIPAYTGVYYTGVYTSVYWCIPAYTGVCNGCNMGARDLPDMYAPEARGPQAQGMRAYISGKSRAHMLQIICITSVRGRALSRSSLMHTFA